MTSKKSKRDDQRQSRWNLPGSDDPSNQDVKRELHGCVISHRNDSKAKPWKVFHQSEPDTVRRLKSWPAVVEWCYQQGCRFGTLSKLKAPGR